MVMRESSRTSNFVKIKGINGKYNINRKYNIQYNIYFKYIWDGYKVIYVYLGLYILYMYYKIFTFIPFSL